MQSIGYLVNTQQTTTWDKIVDEVRALIKSGKKFSDLTQQQEKAYHYLKHREAFGLEDLSVDIEDGIDDVTPPTSSKQEPTIDPKKRLRGQISESPPTSNVSR